MNFYARARGGSLRACSVVCAAAFILSLSSLAGATPRRGATPAAQPGVLHTQSGTASIPGSWLISTTGMYGFELGALEDDDSRQRAAARLALGYAPWRFLQIALSIETAIESYQWPTEQGQSLVVGALGDPRLSLRTGWDLGSSFGLGFMAEVWFPSGRGAFNVVGNSFSPSFFLMASFAPERVPLGIHLNIGYRHDRSVHMLGDVTQLSREQLLLSGGTSASEHLVLSLAAEYRIGPVAPFVDFSSDLPVSGDVANTAGLLSVGLRAWLGPGDAVQLMLAADIRVTGAPEAPNPAAQTVWQQPPRVAFWLSAAFRLPVEPEIRTEHLNGDDPIHSDDPIGAQDVETGRISGHVLCDGVACGTGARVSVVDSDASAMVPDPESGAYSTLGLPPGSYNVEADAPGRDALRQTVVVEAGQSAGLDFDLVQSAVQDRPSIRGRITNFEGAPVAATVRIPALGVEIEADADGRFNTDAEPGRYEVVVSAQGYRTQQTRVEVAEGVVVMNIELRSR